jgi:hypothetical protein
MRPEEVKVGVVFEWAYTPNFKVSAKMTIEELTPDYHAWVRFNDSGTRNCLSVSTLLSDHARLVEPAL